MPLRRGEKYTDIEVSIMRQLGKYKNRLKLYELLRKTETNARILLAVSTVKIHNYSFKGEYNSVEPISGNVTMDDVAVLRRDLAEENPATTLREDGLKFCLGSIISNQCLSTQMDVAVFGLNTCGIDHISADFGNYRNLIANFNRMMQHHKPENVLKRKYIMFPVYIMKDVYCTFIANPEAAVKSKLKKSEGKCHMVHMGSGNLDEYEKKVVPRIMKVLRLFYDLNKEDQQYYRFMEKSIVVSQKKLGPVEYYERPFLLLTVFEKFLRSRNRLSDWESTIMAICPDPETTERDMVAVRERLCRDLSYEVMMKKDKVGLHLWQKREKLVEHERAQLLQRRDEEENDDDNDE